METNKKTGHGWKGRQYGKAWKQKYVIIEARSTMDATRIWRTLIQAKKDGKFPGITRVDFKKEYQNRREDEQDALQQRSRHIHRRDREMCNTWKSTVIPEEKDHQRNGNRTEKQEASTEERRKKEERKVDFMTGLCLENTNQELCFLQPSAKVIEIKRVNPMGVASEYKIIFVNVHGDFRNKLNKYSPFRIFLNKQKMDIMGCCETKIAGILKIGQIDNVRLVHQPSYYRASTSEMKPSNGMCVLYTKDFEQRVQINRYATDFLTTAIVEEIRTVVIFVYVPPMDRINALHVDRAWKELDEVVEIFQTLQYAILIMGDLNARNKETGDTMNNQSGKRLIDWCRQKAMRILNIEQCKGERTFHADKPATKVSSIVDYAIVNDHPSWKEKEVKIEVLQQYVASDHYPIKCTIKGRVGLKGKSTKLHVPYTCKISNDQKQIEAAAKQIVNKIGRSGKLQIEKCTNQEGYDLLMAEIYNALIGKKVITLKKNKIGSIVKMNLGQEKLMEILDKIDSEIQRGEHGTKMMTQLVERYKEEQKKHRQWE
ncbi:hypothetical protein RFI_32001, partial [Reticulomyxa filosa]